MDLTMGTEQVGGTLVVRVVGDLDVATEPTFTAALRRFRLGDAPVVIVDLSGVTFLDARGLAALVRLRRRVNVHAGRLGLVTSPRVLTLLHLAGLDAVFEIFATAQDAIGYLADSAGYAPSSDQPRG